MSLRCCAKCDFILNNRFHKENCPACGSSEMKCPIEDTRDWNKLYKEQKERERKQLEDILKGRGVNCDRSDSDI